MPILRLTIVSLFCCTLFSACASSPVDSRTTQFLTRISESGLKHFEIRSRSKRGEKREAIRNPQQAKARQRQESRIRPKKLERKLKNIAEEHITQNGFCRTGFWVIDSNLYGPRLSLRGECHEPANTEDRRKFPDTIKEW